jgi:hypothetical protein
MFGYFKKHYICILKLLMFIKIHIVLNNFIGTIPYWIIIIKNYTVIKYLIINGTLNNLE